MKTDLRDIDCAHIMWFFHERFGIPVSLFDDFDFISGSRQRIYLVSGALGSHPKRATGGLNLARLAGGVKPSTNFMQMFGGSITKNRMELTRQQAKDYISGKNLELETNAIGEITDGYVAPIYAGSCLGCSFLKNGTLQNLLPKSHWRKIEYL